MKIFSRLLSANVRVRVFVAVFALACLASLAYVFSRPPVYVSTARLQLEPMPGPRRDEGAGSGDAAPNLITLTQSLTGSAVMDELRQQFGAKPGGADPLRGALTASPVAGSNVIEMRAEGRDRDLLPRILEAWIAAFRRSDARAFDGHAGAALEQASADAERLKQEVAAKQLELERFRRKYDIVAQEQEESQESARLRSLNAALNQARTRLLDAEARLAVIRDGIAAGKPVSGSTERELVLDLEKRAATIRGEMKDRESGFTPRYLEADPGYKALRANLAAVERQIEEERQSSSRRALQKAEEEVVGTRQAVARLQQELSQRRREAQDSDARFSEHQALADRLASVKEDYESARKQVAQLERERRPATTLTVLSHPALPERADHPDYLRDAAIGVAGSGVLGILAVWFVEFFRRSGVPVEAPVVQPIIHISYPPGLTMDPDAVAMRASVPILGASATRLPETIASLPRELSIPEVRALWRAATQDARLAIAGLLAGLSLEELAALRYEHVDFGGCYVRVPGVSQRSCTLRDPLRRMLSERRAARGGEAPLSGAGGEPISGADIEGLISCAACDAGLTSAAEVTSETLRHTYLAYLIRQGTRLAEIGEFVGRIPPAMLRDYARLSPPGPGLPLEDVDPLFPALRQADCR